ncbi:putative periplasmic serine endoprotease DegP-like precursor [Candidatus Rubidus massiliensis]|nr:putative periplasmic serine endoprotease DegP-like precursor [Candidatus Rubidus massiliensis]
MKKKHIFALLVCTLFSLGSISHAVENAAIQVENDFRAVAKKAIPAVVSIRVKSGVKSNLDSSADPNDIFGDDFFRFFFRFPNDIQKQPTVGQGSGFIVSENGYILTNSHVVKDADEITITTNDGNQYSGKVIGQDPNTDIAVVKIEANNLPFLELGNSDHLEVGQWVIAIGNPLGLQASLTVGVVSAKGRNNLDLARIEDFIQTDAAINRGNSGGPLLTMDGKVIGINTAIASNGGTGGYMGIGFAIPSNMAKYDMEQILDKGKVSRGYIGVVLQQIDYDLSLALGLPKVEGALIAEIAKGSPAEKAGLQQGDIIIKFNNNPVQNVGSFRNAISMMSPGTSLQLQILSQDKTPKDIQVTIAEFPGSLSEVTSAASVEENKLGIEVQNITPDLARSLNLDQTINGVVISKIKTNSVANWAGLKKGMLIISVNQAPVHSAEEFNAAIKKADSNKPILLLVKSGEIVRYLSLKAS